MFCILTGVQVTQAHGYVKTQQMDMDKIYIERKNANKYQTLIKDMHADTFRGKWTNRCPNLL